MELFKILKRQYLNHKYTPFRMCAQMKTEQDISPYTVLVEGNIGSGKSKFLENFANIEDVKVINEQVEAWKNHNGYNLLELMYKNNEGNFAAFQLKAFLTQLKAQTEKGSKVKIIERSLHSARYCFVENRKKEGKNDLECSILEEWYDMIIDNIPLKVDLIIYLRTSPHIALARTQGRGRKEEDDLNLEFFTRLHNVHDDWLLRKKYDVPARVIIIDADKHYKDLVPEIEKIARIIRKAL